ncbi:MAG: hypothetical protein FWC87_00045 [Acidimicrobiaceae bacterium]|nr:hypothetical protein [Acidimicrobiaceae bacterium]
MPNHVTNILRLQGNAEHVAQAFEGMRSEGSPIDFEKIVPPPANMFRDDLSEADRRRCAEQGIPNWYDWQVANWGTKWNAYTITEGEGEVRFQTAWSAPMPVFEALSRQHPDLDVVVRYADEDFGNNVGEFTLRDGVETAANHLGGYTPEAEALAADILGYRPHEED